MRTVLRSGIACRPTTYTCAVLFMVIEDFRNGDPKPVHDRFVARGRMLPERVTYHGSWIDPVRARCYQVMEAENADALDSRVAGLLRGAVERVPLDQLFDLVDRLGAF